MVFMLARLQAGSLHAADYKLNPASEMPKFYTLELPT